MAKKFDEELVLLDYEKGQSPFGQPIEFADDDEKNRIVNDICALMDEYDQARDAEFWKDKWDEADDDYECKAGYEESPFDFASDYFLPLLRTKHDIYMGKAEEQIFTDPFVMCKPKAGKQADADLKKKLENKQAWVNAKLAEDVKIQQALSPVMHDTTLKGTGFAKPYYCRRARPVTACERYSPAELDKFLERFKDHKKTEAYKEAIADLILGRRVKMYVSKTEIYKDHPVVAWVPLKNLHIHPHLPLEDHRCIGEETEMSWNELYERALADNWDIDELEKIAKGEDNAKAERDEKENKTPEYKKKIYKVIEARYLYNYDGYGDKWTIVTILRDEKKILDAVSWPYEFSDMDYEIYRIIDIPGSNFGDGLHKLLSDTNKMLNKLWNITVDAGVWSNSPTFKAAKGKQSGNPMVEKWGPAHVWWVEDIKNVEQFPIQRSSVDLFRFIELLLRFADTTTGISDYSSGRESPMDPNAPASKALMLLQESNRRIAKGIEKMHKSNEKLVEKIVSMYQQYYEFDNDEKYYDKDGNELNEEDFTGTDGQYVKGGHEEHISYGGKEWTITEEDLFAECKYVATMSPLTINKAMQHQVDQQTIAFAAKMFPQKFIQKLDTYFKIFIKNAPGDWPNYEEELTQLPPQGLPGMPPGVTPPTEAQSPTEGAPGMPDMPREFLSENVRGMV